MQKNCFLKMKYYQIDNKKNCVGTKPNFPRLMVSFLEKDF